jgi:hypothetical protein
MTSVVFFYSIDNGPTLHRGKYRASVPLEGGIETILPSRVLIGLNNSMLQWELPIFESVQIGPLLYVDYEANEDPQKRVWYDFYGIEDEHKSIAYVHKNSNKL